MEQKILFVLIPIILSIGIIPALPFADSYQPKADSYKKIDFETQCREGLVLVKRLAHNNYACVRESTSEKWIQLGIAESVEKTKSEISILQTTMPSVETNGNKDVHEEVLFTNVNVFDGTSEVLKNEMNVLVVGNKIQTISKNDISSDLNTLVINGNGRTLMPGLIDIHTHIAMVDNVRIIESNLRMDDVAILSTIHANDWLMDGYTTVRDIGGPVFGLKRAIDSGSIPGPRIFPSGAIISQTSGHGDWRAPNDPNPSLSGERSSNLERMEFFWIADGVPDVLAATRQNLMQGASQIKIMAGGGGSSSYDPIDTCQFTLDEIKAVVDAADDWNTYVTAHTFQPRCMQELIEAGVMALDHAFMLDDATAKMAAEKGVWILPQMNGVSPYLLENPNLPQDKLKVIEGLQDNGQNMVDLIKKYNIKTGLATDVLGLREDGSKQRHYELHIHSEFYGNHATLVHATSMGGELVAMSGPRNNYDGTLGVIEEGALADILLVDGNPLEDLSVIGANPKWYDAELSYGVDTINLIMKDGIIYKNTL